MKQRLPLLVLAAAALHGAIGFWYCGNGLLNADEAFYGLAAREATGGAVPYRDFGFTQFPVVPYAHGLVMRVIGFGFFEQRVTAGLWAAATVLLGALWLKRRSGAGAALVFSALLAVSAGWMYNVHLGKTYAVTGCCALALAVVMLAELSPRAKLTWSACLGALALGCRLPLAPFVAVVWLHVLLEQPTTRGKLAALFAPLVATALVLGPFALLAPENFWFWTIGFHRESVALRNFHVVPAELWTISPALWLTSGALVALAAWRRMARPAARELWLGGAVLAGLAANLLPRGAYAEYAAPLVPAALLLVIVIGSRLERRLVGPGVALAGAAGVFSFVLAAPPTDPDIYAQVRLGASAVRQVLPLDAEFNGPATLLALETGHRIDRRLVMTPFSFVETTDEAWAAAHHLATPAWLTARMRERTLPVYALTTQPRWNFGRSMPDYRFTSPAVLQAWRAELERDYTNVYANGACAIFVRRETLKKP